MSSKIQQLVPEKAETSHELKYMLGLRGWFVISSFLWTFLSTFVPAAVAQSDEPVGHTSNQHGPTYQVVLRKTLSVLFWNETLIYSAFILISARTICLPFLRNPDKIEVASQTFRRGLRFYLPVAVSLALVQLLFSQSGLGLEYVQQFIDVTENVEIALPYKIPNALAWFNSAFGLFWQTQKYFDQAGSYAFPSQTLWFINLIYQQSFTIYMTQCVVPYTRNSWRLQAFILMILGAWWVQSWAWYSVTGLLIADLVMNMNFIEKQKRGLHVYGTIYLPSKAIYIFLIVVGWLMQYLWVAWRPEYANRENFAHTGLYQDGNLNAGFDPKQPQARDDNYFVLLGLFLLIETSEMLQLILGNPFFTFIGRRSLSKP